jgi:cell division transport system ATP-binding protein
LIQMWNVSKTYPNGTVALDDVTTRIRKGEFVFVVGASGAGKSTFIKLIYREEIPNSGMVIINSKNVNRMRRTEVAFLRRNIGVVFQDFRLLSTKTVFENVSFAMEVVEASDREIGKRVPAVLELVGLSHKQKSLPSQLSGGEQQRIAIARAIVNNPAIVVADEPTGNLDPRNSWEIIRIFEEINQRGTTVVIGTHAKDIVDHMHKRVITIENGRLVSDQEKGVYGYEAPEL